jgi:hypothetical protein
MGAPSRSAVNRSIDGRAVGRVTREWNERYPATPLRIDAVAHDTVTIYSAQLSFPDGSDAEFAVAEEALCAPTLFPCVLTQRGPRRYSQGQWALFDILCDGALRLVTERMGGVWNTHRPTHEQIVGIHLPWTPDA